MAFPAAPGYVNLPNGNFSPTIFSQKVLKAFRKRSVADDLTNTDYAGEIANYGDTVQIILEPDVTVSPYVRGQALSSQPLDDNKTTLTITQANWFQFAVDDIEKKQSHVNWLDMAASRAAYKLTDAYDSDVIGTMFSLTPSANQFGNLTSLGSTKSVGFAAGSTSPMQVMNRLKRILDVNNVPDDNRWFVADPFFWELAGDENSKLLNHLYTSEDEELLRNGRVSEGMIAGFKCYRSNNMTSATLSSTACFSAMAGHKSAFATASQLAEVETFRSQTAFADVTRGLHLYGRNLLRGEALASCAFQIL